MPPHIEDTEPVIEETEPVSAFVIEVGCYETQDVFKALPLGQYPY